MIGIDPEKACFIVVKAREYEVKVPPVEPDPGSNPTDESMVEILSDYPGDATYQELKAFLDALNEEEMVSLLALVWLGRGDFSKGEWESALEQAREVRDEKAADYLLGIPLLPDYLEMALAEFEYSCEEFELGRL
jgi:hypothetical protein